MDTHPNTRVDSCLDATSDNHCKTICVIGAGVSGLAALKVIMDTPQYKAGLWKPTAFESRENIGGVWLPAPPTHDPPLTPLYDSLITNLPHPVMCFTSFPFPPSTSLFPHASIVQTYLESYADHFHLRPHIRLNLSVDSVARDLEKYHVRLSTGEILAFDFVIVCNGHYNKPRYPNTPGISHWLRTGRATHSAWYRRPHNLGDTILVVGGGPSGQDISSEMRTAARTVIHSVTGTVNEDVGNLKRRARVSVFEKDGRVVFEDGSVESGIDHCILATGYEMSFPFLPQDIIRTAIPPLAPPLPQELHNSTYNVFPLAKHLFPLHSASNLAFMGLLFKAAPLPLIEAQAHAVVYVFAHSEALDRPDDAADIMARYEHLRAKHGNDPLAIAKPWHRFEQGHEQFDYRDQLYAFAELPVQAQAWEREMYARKDMLRKSWVGLVKSGKDREWSEGVGEKGPHEWVDMMERMLKWAEENDVHVDESEKIKI